MTIDLTTRNLLISLCSHMSYMQGQLEALHQLDDPDGHYWFRKSVALRQKVADHLAALADEPAEPEGKKPTRDELWELWLRLNNELPDRPAAVAAFWEHAKINARARAALADEPAVPEGREPASVTEHPSDEDLLGIACQSIEPYDKIRPGEYEAENECAIEVYGSELVTFARAVLARWGNPVPQPPAEGEVAELVAWLREIAQLWEPDAPRAKQLFRAADLLERLAPQPPSLAEQALGALEQIDGWAVSNMNHLSIHDDLVTGVEAIRTALERLQELEGTNG